MDDMSELLKKFSTMVEKDGIPDNLKEIVNNFNSSNSDKNCNPEPSSFEGIDMATILKMKSLMDGFSSKSSNDPRANLLRSLKPYLKDNRKEKLDQYMQFINMSKIFDSFKNSGGDGGT